jgi:outer membrane lipoprotein SlyB
MGKWVRIGRRIAAATAFPALRQRLAARRKEAVLMGSAMKVVVLLLVVATAFGCASYRREKRAQKRAARAEAMGPSETAEGEVTEVRMVTIEGSSSTWGTLLGAGTGYAVGRSVTSGRSSTTRTVGRVGGAVAGGAAGSAVSKKLNETQGIEIKIELDDGRVVTVVQKAGRVFQVGDSVVVTIRGDGKARVVQ